MHTERKNALTVLIIDDEVWAADSLRLMIEKFIPKVIEIADCTDARQAAACIAHYKPQIVFLDIKMPYLSGFEILQQIPNQTFKVIFTTAFDEFAVKAIRFSAFDYLLKPVDAEELINTFNRYFSLQTESPAHAALLNNMVHNMQSAGTNLRLAIPTREGVHFIEPANIIYCEGVNNYTRFYTNNEKQFLTSKTLGEYEDLLEAHEFIRCHKSYIVNKSFIAYVDYEGLITLKNGLKLTISKRRKAKVMSWMKR